MKIQVFAFLIIFGVISSSCQTQKYEDGIVSQSYVHRYGVPLPEQEWADRGRDGQVVSMRKDGVRITQTFEGGVLHGETSYTYPHQDVIEKKEKYYQGNVVEEFNYYQSGLPQQQISYISPSEQKKVVWYETGSPHCSETYQSGCLVNGTYYNPSYQLESQISDREGQRIKRDPYGHLISVDHIQQGELSLSTTYHPQGTPAALTPYKEGVIEGQRRTFAVTGEPSTIETWTGGVQHGPTVGFQNGEKSYEVSYTNGQRHGVEYRFRDGDKVVQEVNWVDGKKHGRSHSYVGSEKQTDWYFQDRPVNKATFDALSHQ